MTLLFFVAILAGAASVLSPCVLPLLPSILAVSGASGGRRRVAGLIIGIELSFIGISLLLSSVIAALGLPDTFLQYAAAVILIAFGLVLIVPKLDEAFQRVASRGVSMIPRRSGAPRQQQGFWSGLLAGSGLGFVWTPCAGPFLASVVSLGQSGSGASHESQAIAITAGFALGMLVPLTIIVIGGRTAGAALRTKLGGGKRILAPMGVILLITGIAVGTGALTRLDNELTKLGLTGTPTASLEKKALKNVNHSERSTADRGEIPTQAYLEKNGYPASSEEAPGQLVNYGPAPDFAGITHWYNTDGTALTIKDLRGKVVLVDFWTYSCINCLRTLPRIRELDRKYRDMGLVIVGVHTPEFSFEKDVGNVGKAITDLKVKYPVALDPDYATWNNFHNQYWPAHYLIDRDGNIRATHYGEGNYDETEQLVRKLLKLKATPDVGAEAAGGEHFADSTSRQPITPETWFGADKISGNQFASTVDGKVLVNGDQLPIDRVATYAVNATDAAAGASSTAPLPANSWAFTGAWRMTTQHSDASGPGAQMLLHYQATDVYLVAGPGTAKAGAATLTVHDGTAPAKTIHVDAHKLYTLRAGAKWHDGLVTVDVSHGVELYSLTFG